VASMFLTALAVEDRPLWRGAVDGLLDFVRDELTDSQGGLHTALQAASQAATGDQTYVDQAAAALAAFGGMMRARPDAHVHLVAAAERYLRRAAAASQGSPAP